MPSWLLLVLVVAGFTLVAPAFVFCVTGGDWRRALTAWRQYCTWLALLALPGAAVWLGLIIWPPSP